MPGPATDLYAWVVVGAFAASVLVERRDERLAQQIAAGGWTLFAGFWGVLVPHFFLWEKSFIEGSLSALAVPACLYTAYLLHKERAGLLVLSRAVAFMGLIYLPFTTIVALEKFAIEGMTYHVEFILESFGYDFGVQTGDKGYRSEFVYVNEAGHRFVTPVLLACSGIGSVAVVSGLILAVRAPMRRKAVGLAAVVPLIYGLNLVRGTFILLAFSKQWFQVFVPQVLTLFGAEDPRLVSYYVSDKIISQSLSVVVLVVITLGLLRLLPPLTTIIEEVAYVATGREYDLESRVSTT